ncbi:MAG: LptF/LptG family permease [Mariprofundaceae bacterium]|nr:LptF/LptG family permease [Mariprofundaceae bacterium]
MKILDRYMLRNFALPFLTSLAVVTGVLLFGRALNILSSLSDNGLGFSLMIQLLWSILPYFLVLTVPIAFFFAMQSTLMRLNQDSEMDALRAAGISYPRTLRSLIMVAFLLYLSLCYVALVWMPQGTHSFRIAFYNMDNMKLLKLTPQQFSDSMDDLTVYVQGQDETGLYHQLMMEDRRSGTPIVYLAKTAAIEWRGEQIEFILYQGTRLEGKAPQLRMASFDQYQTQIKIAQSSTKNPMPWRNTLLEMPPMELWKVVQSSDNAEATAEWHRRLLLPTTIIVLLLFVLPLSLSPKRSMQATAYLWGVLLMFAVYNIQVALFQQVASAQLPWGSMWLGQGLMASLGLTWFIYACKNSGSGMFPWTQ